MCHVPFARPTFLWTNAQGVRQQLVHLGAELVDHWQDATCHVVDSFSEPGQRVSWTAELNGHLIVTKELSKGPWIQNLGLRSLVVSLCHVIVMSLSVIVIDQCQAL